ncbi:hypothetical protein M422DRAFT_25216 [Sphaerobolus stellatus SS14]|nr:hypothetical protein M422DRAFT_25216 [Sphaerobolus stellatus SS14]
MFGGIELNSKLSFHLHINIFNSIFAYSHLFSVAGVSFSEATGGDSRRRSSILSEFWKKKFSKNPSPFALEISPRVLDVKNSTAILKPTKLRRMRWQLHTHAEAFSMTAGF